MWRCLSLVLGLLTLPITPIRAEPPVRLSLQWTCKTSQPAPGDIAYSERTLTPTSRYLLVEELQHVIDRRTGKIVWSQSGASKNAPASFARASLYGCSFDGIALIVTPSCLEGIDLKTGTVLWTMLNEEAGESGLARVLYGAIMHPTVFGSVFALTPVGKGVESGRAEFYDIHTGRQLNPGNPADALFLKQSIARYGSASTLISYKSNCPYTLDLLTRVLTPDRTFKNFLSVKNTNWHLEPLFLTGQQITYFVYKESADEYRSATRRYLLTTDLSGGELWEFPKYLHSDQRASDLGNGSHEFPFYIPGAHCLLVTTESLYGIDIRTGKQLWQGVRGYYNYAPCGGGALVISRATGRPDRRPRSTVFYLDGATGVRSPLLTGLTEQEAIKVEGDQMFLIDGYGTVRAYNIQRTERSTAEKNAHHLIARRK